MVLNILLGIAICALILFGAWRIFARATFRFSIEREGDVVRIVLLPGFYLLSYSRAIRRARELIVLEVDVREEEVRVGGGLPKIRGKLSAPLRLRESDGEFQISFMDFPILKTTEKEKAERIASRIARVTGYGVVRR